MVYTCASLASVFSIASLNEALLMVSSPSEKRAITGQTSGCLRLLRRLVAVSRASNSGVDPPLGKEATRSAVSELRQSPSQTGCASLPLNDKTDTLSSGLQ